jgi:hypothetical protein
VTDEQGRIWKDVFTDMLLSRHWPPGPVFVVVFVVFVVSGCIVYVLAVVVSFIVVFLYCVCALFVCNVLLVCFIVVLLPLG